MKKYLEQNISIIPINKGLKTPAIKSWKEYMYGRMSFEQLDTLFNGCDVAMIGGKVSGNLECLDFDNKLDNAKDVMSEFYSIEAVQDLIDKRGLPMQDTPSGGFHILYKCESEVEASQKLARQLNESTGKPEVLIETRGEGGYFLVDPSTNYKAFGGEIGEIPVISKEERDLLISAAKSLNVYYDKPQRSNRGNVGGSSNASVGDEYNQSSQAVSDTIRLLRSAGWTSSNDIHWVRPNKKKGSGISATLGKVAEGMLYIFSSNASPFEDGQGYYPFAVKALLDHNGDYRGCVRDLVSQGFGVDFGAARKKIESAVTDARKKGFNLSPTEIQDLAIDNKMQIKDVEEFASKVKTEVATLPKPTDKPKKLKLIELEGYLDNIFDIRFNKVLNIVEFKGKKEKQYRDVNVFDMMRQASVDGFEVNETQVNAILGSTSIRTEYDPFLEYFEGLPKWDKKDHVKELCSFFALSNEERRPFFESMMCKAMIRTIKCGLDENYYNRMVLALISPKQELGKSYFMRWLNPVGDRYYNESPIVDNKDALISYTNSFIYNIEELDNAGKTGLSALKRIISIQSVNVRAPYAKQASHSPRRCTFWATTNEKDFLEEKHNSRWLCFDIEDIDKNYSKKIDLDQLWSQIYILMNDGAEMELTESERFIRDNINTSYVEETVEQSVCRKIFVKSDKWMSNADIYKKIAEYSTIRNPHNRRVGRAMSIVGFEKKTKQNTIGWMIEMNPDIMPI